MTRIHASAFAAAAAALLFAGAASACPDWERAPPFGAVDLTRGLSPDPYERYVGAEGNYNLAWCGFNWTGYVARAPDFDLYYDAGGYDLTFYVQSNTDTILLINDPTGTWHFNDDGGTGHNPSITFYNPMSGLYDVWVGTYTQANNRPSRLYITEY